MKQSGGDIFAANPTILQQAIEGKAARVARNQFRRGSLSGSLHEGRDQGELVLENCPHLAINRDLYRPKPSESQLRYRILQVAPGKEVTAFCESWRRVATSPPHSGYTAGGSAARTAPKFSVQNAPLSDD